MAVAVNGMVHIQAVVRGWIVLREYGTDVAGIVRVQALARRWLAHRVARWERWRRCGPQLSLGGARARWWRSCELVALVHVQSVWPRGLVSAVACPRGGGGAVGGVVTAADRSLRGCARRARGASRPSTALGARSLRRSYLVYAAGSSNDQRKYWLLWP